MNNVKETLLPILGSSYKAVKQVMFQTSTDPARPEYHFRAPGQWTDDPAGAIYYNGYYHIMYSWNPNSCLYRAGLVWKRPNQPWDPNSEEYHGFITVWGHARSKDLIHWEHLPISNYPVIDKGEEYIWYGCTTINREGVPVEIYTSVGPHKSPEATADQWIKFGDPDLIYWDNFDGNPILEVDDHNGDIIRHWRDPFVFSNGEKDYMLLGGSLQNDQNHVPVLLIYEAANASFTKWKYKGIFYRYDNLEANSLECPNIAKIGDKWVLLFSPFGQVEYHIGTIDFETCTFHDEKSGMVDYSRNYYATNIMHDDKDRYVLWGSILTNNTLCHGWNNCMGIPRIISLDVNNNFIQKPAEELEQLRGTNVNFKGGVYRNQHMITQNHTGTFEIIANMKPGCEIVLRYGGHDVIFNWDFDGFYADDCLIPLDFRKEQCQVHIFVDKTIVDVFIDNQKSASKVIPVCIDCEILVASKTQEEISVDVWEINGQRLFTKSKEYQQWLAWSKEV